MTAPTVPAASVDAALARDPNLRPLAQGAWTLYDFANTIFSFAIVSGAMGLWLSADSRLGETTGQVVFSIALLASVGLNAIVSPVLGALSDRGGRRLPFLFAFSAMCIIPTAFIGFSAPAVGALLFIVANFGYQAALIYYDSTLKLVSTPPTRGRLSGIGTGVGYAGSIFAGLLIFLVDVPLEGRFALAAILFALFAIPIFAFVHDHPDPDAERIGPRGRARVLAADPDDDPPRPARARPAAVPRRAVLLLGRGEHDHRRHEPRRREGGWACPTATSCCSCSASRSSRSSCRSCGATSPTGSARS